MYNLTLSRKSVWHLSLKGKNAHIHKRTGTRTFICTRRLYVQKDMYKNVLYTIAKNWNPPESLLIIEKRNVLCYVYYIILYLYNNIQ